MWPRRRSPTPRPLRNPPPPRPASRACPPCAAPSNAAAFSLRRLPEPDDVAVRILDLGDQ
jgi:hypothetical protein